MAISIVTVGRVRVYTGTMAEVAQALSDNEVPQGKFTILFNGTNISAVVKF